MHVLIFLRPCVCVHLSVALGCRGQQPAAPSDQVTEVGVFPLPAVACMSASPSFFSLPPRFHTQACLPLASSRPLPLARLQTTSPSLVRPSLSSSPLLTGCSSPAAGPRSLREARQLCGSLARLPALGPCAARSASLTRTWTWLMMFGQNNKEQKKKTSITKTRVSKPTTCASACS